MRIRVSSNFDCITMDPPKINGQPCIRDMRITVVRVVESVAVYPDRADLFNGFPEIDGEDVRQALAFAAANLDGLNILMS